MMREAGGIGDVKQHDRLGDGHIVIGWLAIHAMPLVHSQRQMKLSSAVLACSDSRVVR